MKHPHLIRAGLAALIFAACLAIMPSCSTSTNSCFFKMAFGNAIRSLEGTPLANDATKIPAELQTLANLWLPKDSAFTTFLNNDVINPFLAAHPVTPEEVNKVLETIAMSVQSGCK